LTDGRWTRDSDGVNLREEGFTLGERICEIEVEIKNADGLHMRPAMQFVDVAGRFTSDIKVGNDQANVDAKSIMQMTMLAATFGTKLHIRAEGSDAKEAVKALRELVEVRMFDEAPGKKVEEEQRG
jgi:phosphotransferase system HPr (HPr) family protein